MEQKQSPGERGRKKLKEKMGWCIVCDAKNAKHLCGGCKAVEYCSVECQKKDHPQHKRICRRFQDDTFREKEFNCMVMYYFGNRVIPVVEFQNLSDGDIYLQPITDYKMYLREMKSRSITDTEIILDSIKYILVQRKNEKKFIFKRYYCEYRDSHSYSGKISTNPKSKLFHTKKEVLEKLLNCKKFKKVLNNKVRSIK